MSAGAGHIPNDTSTDGGSGEPIVLKHDVISMEPYSEHAVECGEDA